MNVKRGRAITTRIIGRLGRMIDHPLRLLAARSPMFASVYWCLMSGSFRREHFAVACGMARYAADCASPRGCRYLLRRNIHRIEKGLLMRPFRDLFALDYIRETVVCYDRMARAAADGCADTDEHELLWAHDVLSSYFAAAGDHPAIASARSLFDLVEHPCAHPDRLDGPYARDLGKPPPVSYDALLELAHRRRSVRWYRQERVPREMIDRAVELAALSPSGCNRQAFEFRIFDEPDLARRVASIPQGTGGFCENLPVVVALVGKLRAYSDARDRHLIYIDGGLAAMSFVLALETLGLSSCCLNWPDVGDQEREMVSLLNLEPDERVVLLIAVGYPDPEGMVATSRKKSLERLRRYNLP